MYGNTAGQNLSSALSRLAVCIGYMHGLMGSDCSSGCLRRHMSRLLEGNIFLIRTILILAVLTGIAILRSGLVPRLLTGLKLFTTITTSENIGYGKTTA
jgi:hypothetical protein